MSEGIGKRKFVPKKLDSIEDKIIRYIETGIREKRLKVYEIDGQSWYGLHIKNYLTPAVGGTKSATQKALRRLQADKRLMIRWVLWERATWEIAVRFPEHER